MPASEGCARRWFAKRAKQSGSAPRFTLLIYEPACSPGRL
jgi:hypothetical protein